MTLTILSLSACGGSKKIITSDDSADYKSARSLPPLTKPSRPVASQDKVVLQPAVVATAVDVVIEQSLPLVSAPTTIASQNSDQQISAPQIAVEPANSVPLSNAQGLANSATDVSATGISTNSVVSRVINDKSGQSRLEIAADFDLAWEFLSTSLQKSDLTVFSRNKEAGRFSIGCANIAKVPTVVKSGRWSFFNRDKQQSLEYCALQSVSKRGITMVSVLNQAGEEVSGEYSNRVFSRILNN